MITKEQSWDVSAQPQICKLLLDLCEFETFLVKFLQYFQLVKGTLIRRGVSDEWHLEISNIVFANDLG